MKEFISHLLTLYKPKPIDEVIREDLDNAQRKLLEHQSSAEYHQHMTAFYKTVIDRLTSHTYLPKENYNDNSLKSHIVEVHHQQVGRSNP